MDITLDQLAALRPVTDGVVEVLQARMTDAVSTLAPLLRPQAVLGEFVVGASKDPVGGAAQAFEAFQALFKRVASVKPFRLSKPLVGPIEVMRTAFEMTPLEYQHTLESGTTVTVRSPLRWVLTPLGFGPERLRKALRTAAPAEEEVRSLLVHWLLVHFMLERNPGVRRVLEGLRFPVKTEQLPEFGELPVTVIGSDVGTVRPVDAVVARGVAFSGTPQFQEVIDIASIAGLQDGLRAQLVDIVRAHDAALLPSGGG